MKTNSDSDGFYDKSRKSLLQLDSTNREFPTFFRWAWSRRLCRVMSYVGRDWNKSNRFSCFSFLVSSPLSCEKKIKFMASIACNRFSISKRLCSFVIFRAESSTKFTAWNSRRKRRGKKWSKKFFFSSRRIVKTRKKMCIENRKLFSYDVLPFVTIKEGSDSEFWFYFFSFRSHDAISIMKMAHKYLIKNTNWMLNRLKALEVTDISWIWLFLELSQRPSSVRYFAMVIPVLQHQSTA